MFCEVVSRGSRLRRGQARQKLDIFFELRLVTVAVYLGFYINFQNLSALRRELGVTAKISVSDRNRIIKYT